MPTIAQRIKQSANLMAGRASAGEGLVIQVANEIHETYKIRTETGEPEWLPNASWEENGKRYNRKASPNWIIMIFRDGSEYRYRDPMMKWGESVIFERTNGLWREAGKA